ncbi:unnamed protein product [Litomosoides sigmodontis]|uniref:Uncharacterized protein n=1 Tax=Litomosoides sigmodontis TaxID=42156 RepID=A0A3P6TDB0_LITSI|nr:unnamed protein product [Litomosoides sigmodontis]
MESGNLNGSRVLYNTTELTDVTETALPAVILTSLIVLEIAMAILTLAYIKNVTNKSIEHLQSIGEKPVNVENTEQVNQTATDAERGEIQRFNDGINRISEELMNNQTPFKILMEEEINRETMKIIYGMAG